MSPARTSAYLAGVALSAAEGQASRQGAAPVGKRSAGCPWWRTSRLELLCCMKAVGRDWAELRSEACDAVGYAVDLPLCSAWYRSARLEPCAVAGMWGVGVPGKFDGRTYQQFRLRWPTSVDANRRSGSGTRQAGMASSACITSENSARGTMRCQNLGRPRWEQSLACR